MVLGAFLDSFQKIADAASNAKGERKETKKIKNIFSLFK